MSNNAWPRVAVVILSYNGRSFLEQFLPSVVQTKYPNLEIVVADNDSSDNGIDYVRQHFSKVRVIAMDQNRGFAGGYNHALQQVTADYYVLLNQDVEVQRQWIQPVIELMETDETIAACQPKIKWQRDKQYFEYAGAAGGFIDKYGFTFCRGRLFETLEKDKGQYNESSEIFWATGACCFVRADLYHQAGGLDTHFFAHMEEVDLCWRLKNKGYRICYCSDSEVYHVGGGSLSKENPLKTYLNFRNSLALLLKNLPSSQLWILPLRLLIDQIAAFYALLQGRWRNVFAIWRAHGSFLWDIRTWWQRRQQQREVTSSANRKGMYQGSIVWAYFVKGQRAFHQLSARQFNNS